MRSSAPSSATSSVRNRRRSRDGRRPGAAARRLLRRERVQAPVEHVTFIIITGLSGAGKSVAMAVFEDLGYFCVDNLPPQLLPKFADLCLHSNGKIRRVAVAMDIRGGEFFGELFEALDDLEKVGIPYQILFLDASNEVLVRRFKETRRRHPLGNRGVLDAIQAERRRLEAVKERADKIIDTSGMAVRELREEILSTFASGDKAGELEVTVTSFGYKYGLPMDADLIFDCRFLPNPHYDPMLRPLPGNSPEVRQFVLRHGESRQFLRHLYRLVDFLLPQFVKEGKAHLDLAIGCTGGRHRSVVLADELVSHLSGRGLKVNVRHRDIRKD